MTAKVVLNPYSNRWNAQARWPQAEAALKAAGVDFELAISERKGQVTDLVERAARDGFSPIIAAGGDGTIGDAVNGLARAANTEAEPLAPLGILPLGSANDFCFNTGMPVDLNDAARVIAAGNIRTVDLCRCNDRYFANNSGCGLEPYVNVKHERIHWVKGMSRYFVAAVWAIMDKPEWHGEMKWDDGEYRGPLSFISVGNGRRTGGFFMAPHADPFDGKLTLAYGYRATRHGLLDALPRALNDNEKNYIYLDGMYEVHCTKISIRLDKPSPMHTDGELIPNWLPNFEYSIQPGRLRVLMP